MPEKKKMGRPIVGKPKKIRVHLLLDEDQLNKVDTLSKQKGITRNEIIRQLINKAK